MDSFFFSGAFGLPLKRPDVFISVRSKDLNFASMKRDDLSGKYTYHCTKNNTDVFISTETSSNLNGTKYYLIYKNDAWYITNENHFDGKNFYPMVFGAFLSFKTTGLRTLRQDEMIICFID